MEVMFEGWGKEGLGSGLRGLGCVTWSAQDSGWLSVLVRAPWVRLLAAWLREIEQLGVVAELRRELREFERSRCSVESLAPAARDRTLPAAALRSVKLEPA